MIRSHAQGATRVHSGELGVVQVGENEDNGGDTNARSCASAGSRGSKGKALGRPSKALRKDHPTPLSTVPAVTPSAQGANWLQQQQAKPQCNSGV